MDKLLSWIITTTSAGEKIKMLVTDFYPYRQVSILGFFTIKLLISVNSYYGAVNGIKQNPFERGDCHVA